MSYTVEVKTAPFYELLTSLVAYMDKRSHKTYELHPSWVNEVNKQLPAETQKKIQNLIQKVKKIHSTFKGLLLLPYTVILYNPNAPLTQPTSEIIQYIDNFPISDLYERYVEQLKNKSTISIQELEELRQCWTQVLREWNQYYFQTMMDQRICEGLEKDAKQKQAIQAQFPPVGFVEEVTKGIYLQPEEGSIDKVILIPQYHVRPFNIHEHYRTTMYIFYPVDAIPEEYGEPSFALKRSTQAMSDQSRLRILRYLSSKPRRFKEIVMHTGLAKSTVSHHMVILRAAGMVRVITGGGGNEQYELRPSFIHYFTRELDDYLKNDK